MKSACKLKITTPIFFSDIKIEQYKIQFVRTFPRLQEMNAIFKGDALSSASQILSLLSNLQKLILVCDSNNLDLISSMTLDNLNYLQLENPCPNKSYLKEIFKMWTKHSHPKWNVLMLNSSLIPLEFFNTDLSNLKKLVLRNLSTSAINIMKYINMASKIKSIEYLELQRYCNEKDEKKVPIKFGPISFGSNMETIRMENCDSSNVLNLYFEQIKQAIQK